MFGEGWSRVDTRDFIKRCYDRDALLETLLGFSSSWLDAALIGVLGKGKITFQRGAGAWTTLGGESMSGSAALQDMLKRGEPLLEDGGAMGLQSLVRTSAGLKPASLLIVPIVLAGRSVAVLIGCPAPGPVELSLFEEIVTIAQLVAAQLEEIILLAKSGELPHADERIPRPPSPKALTRPAKQSPALPQPALRAAPDDEDELLGFSSASEPYPEALRARQPVAPSPVALFSSKPPSKTLAGGAVVSIDRAPSEGILDREVVSALPRSPFEEESSSVASVGASLSAPSSPSAPRVVAPPAIKPNSPGTTQELPAPNPSHDFRRDEGSGVSIIPPQAVGGGQEAAKKTLMGGFSVADVVRAKQEAERQEAELRAKMRQTLNGVSAVLPSTAGAAAHAPAAQILKPTRRRSEESEAREEAAKHAPQQPAKPVSVEHPFPATPPPTPTSPPVSTTLRVDMLAAQLDQRDLRQVSDALLKLLERADGAEIILKQFPGRLSVDRYQHTVETMPPVEEHGPLLAAAAVAPASFEPVLTALLSATSLEKRFYATLLLTKRSPTPVLGALRERLFDRDLQTRHVARVILLNARATPSFEGDVLAPLRAQLLHAEDEQQAESAAELLGQAHDRGSVEALIKVLEQHKGRAQQTILLALQRITLQPLGAQTLPWQTWWKMGQREARREWLLRALNASSESIRELAAQELARLPGSTLHYNPRQPPAMRIRAQQQLKQWLDQHPELAQMR